MAKLLILYDSQTGNTEKMAQAVAGGAQSIAGVEVELKYYAGSDELAEAAAIAFGAPTYHHEITLPIKQILEEAAKAGAKLEGKIGAAFGSYGWSGEAPDKVIEILKNRFGMRTIEPPIKVMYDPKQEQLDECHKLGERIAQEIAAK
jgi:flavorubredoxin